MYKHVFALTNQSKFVTINVTHNSHSSGIHYITPQYYTKIVPHSYATTTLNHILIIPHHLQLYHNHNTLIP